MQNPRDSPCCSSLQEEAGPKQVKTHHRCGNVVRKGNRLLNTVENAGNAEEPPELDTCLSGEFHGRLQRDQIQAWDFLEMTEVMGCHRIPSFQGTRSNQ